MSRDDVDWDAFDASLSWLPVAEFDCELVPVALLRAGEDEAVGYWADGWRNAQESFDDQPLAFEPVEFAAVSLDWREHLMAD